MVDTNNTCRVLVGIFIGKVQLEGGEGSVKMDVNM
jgi:hypothetical protein